MDIGLPFLHSLANTAKYKESSWLIRWDILSDFEDAAELSEADKRPKPCKVGRSLIFAYAEEAARHLELSFRDTVEDNLEQVVKQRLLGEIKDSSEPNKNGKKASIQVKADKTFTIQLFPSVFPLPLQRRVLIAHELAHYILHSQWGKVELEASCGAESDDMNEEAENEAYEFARAFLVPTDLLRKAVESFGKDRALIAAYFMVPEPIARQRMQDIGCTER